MKHKDIIVFNKIIKYAEEAIDFVNEMTFEGFRNTRMVVAACVFNISQIGELVKNVSDEITNKYKNIEWKAIRSLRHKIVHDYDGVDIDVIWDIIENDLPQLIEDLKNIMNNEK